MPTFSIIVPVYKTEEYLEKCIKSILNQTYSAFELILVDDGSPDNCPKLCDHYADMDKRVKVLHKKNGGVSSARNFGIEVATGDYIWFVDSDDYIEPYALEQLYKAILEESADCYFFNTAGVNKLSEESFNEFLQHYYFTYIVGFGPWNKLYRTSIIQKNNLRFDTEETIGEDLLFNLSYYKCIYGGGIGKTFFYIGRDYYNYVDRVGSAMNTASKGRLVQQMRLFEKIEVMLRESISQQNMTYLFWIHLISGISQSANGGLTSAEFSQTVYFEKFRIWLKDFGKIKHPFYENEHATLLGRIRLTLFTLLMKFRFYRLAGMVFGLK